MPIADIILKSLLKKNVKLEYIANTKIAIVLRLASLRNEFSSSSNFANVGTSISLVLSKWQTEADLFLHSIGLR